MFFERVFLNLNLIKNKNNKFPLIEIFKLIKNFQKSLRSPLESKK